jgi:serine/threonine-protein kinase
MIGHSPGRGSMKPRIIDGKYEIVRELSRGGMGAVYEARHRLTHRKVALKLVLADTLARKGASDALRRFEREARAAGSIESRHVVSILDTGIERSTKEPYIVMELLNGEDLRALIRRRGTLPPELVLAIAFQVCQGLRRAHERNIVHRDIKAANIFLARCEGGQVEVKILDFGIAKLRIDPLASNEGHDLTRSGSVLGSPLYMSPEQATGSREVDARSDIWSLGVVMYEALSGATPHAHQALGAVILSICSEPARALRQRAPWVSEEVAALVHKALALEPSQRFASAEAMGAALEPHLAGGAVIHEALLESSPESSGAETRAGAAQAVAVSSQLQAQTTETGVTYGTYDARHSRPGEARRVRRQLALVGGVAVVTVSAGLWSARDASLERMAADTSSKPAEPSRGALAPPPTATEQGASLLAASTPPGPAGEGRESSSLSNATRSADRSVALEPRAMPKQATRPFASATVPSTSPLRPFVQLPAASAPAKALAAPGPTADPYLHRK